MTPDPMPPIKPAREKSKLDIPLLDSLSTPRWLQKGLAALIVSYAILCIGLFFAERPLLFHPMPAAAGAPAHKTHKSASYLVTQADGALPWENNLCAQGSGAPPLAVAYFGGNAEPASAFAQTAKKFLPGCAAYALAYPGYEGAPGSPSEESINQAADDMMEAMAADGFPPERSILIGRSLGSGVAVRQAALRPCRLAALLTPYESLGKVAADALPWAPAELLMRDKFDTAPFAPNAKCAAAIVFADHDDVIPPHHALALAKSWSKQDPPMVSSNTKATHQNINELESTWSSVEQALNPPKQ